MGLVKSYKRLVNKLASNKYKGRNIELELERIRLLDRFTVGTAQVFDRPFKFHDAASFIATFDELFRDQIYLFEPSKNSNIILDCGANMGLSVLYFAQNYPKHQIIAFEPEEHIFNILQENVNTFQLKNVTLHNKAVWTKSETLEFYSDGGMGGRVNQQYAQQKPVRIDAVPLLDFITEDVDFLKMDIEGAEDEVLKYCSSELHKINNIFFEYHNNFQKKQTLHELLALIQQQGFTYYIKESAKRKRPFEDQKLICETFDMALNVFCYKS
ncbi:FkbM family methyltransferase [Daejeonella oryzae]|uniref:FkbM family methyltransferase n=1 Tax=Daejeonella oryzae TaxID=1122943 RepID=UPI000408B409|nr:FkbM family methyltransferase [Daejeonella oryzae]